MRYEQRKTYFFPSEKNRKMWENFVDNVDNLVHNSFLAENQGDGMWMHFSWILWIKWISCESNMFFVQPDKFTIILQDLDSPQQVNPGDFMRIPKEKVSRR